MSNFRKVRVAIAAVIVAGVGMLVGTPAHAQAAATLTLLHGIPGVNVDVVVDGTVVFPDFKPSESKDLSSFAGQTLKQVEVRPAGGTTAVIGPVDLTLPATGNYTLLAHLTAGGKPTVTPFKNDTSTTPAGQGRLVVVHAAAAPAVDIVVGAARPITNLANGGVQALELPAGSISGAKVAPTGGDPIADVPAVDLVAGTDLIVYAVGALSDNSFTFITQTIAVGEESTDTTSSTAVSTTSTTVPGLPPTGNRETTWMLGLVFLAVGATLVTISRRGASGRA